MGPKAEHGAWISKAFQPFIGIKSRCRAVEKSGEEHPRGVVMTRRRASTADFELQCEQISMLDSPSMSTGGQCYGPSGQGRMCL